MGLSVVLSWTLAECARESPLGSELSDQVSDWGKPGLVKLHPACKWLLFSFKLEFSLSLPLSELLKIGGRDPVFPAHQALGTAPELRLSGRGKWDGPGVQMRKLSPES